MHPAVLWETDRRLEVEVFELRPLGPSDVRVGPVSSGACHTDVSARSRRALGGEPGRTRRDA
jgi:Zn-dependent alcohol dehydrogenase